ncbi:hypothetical protein F5888DRAFT_1808178 [Russula emetica]|nr:hypothetical protein F5888DRAFT_1808178 [Russula emetica]
MSGVAKNKAGAGAKTPRPPNAWIIYRSDKLQELPPPPLGQPKPTQAEVSKIIAAQWRAESEDVRALYDQRAETAKAEHARLYPDYRFAPMKKADKDRIREEKRQAKEQERASRKVRSRVAPYPLPSTASPFRTSSSLIIKHVVPNANSASPSILSSISSSSLSSTIPNSRPGVNVAPYYGPTRVSLDMSTHPQFYPVHSQNPPFNEPLRLGAAVPSESSSSMVPNLTFSIPQPPPPNDWLPSPSAELSPLPDIPLPDWSQSPPSTQDSPEQACAVPTSFICALHFTMPSLESTHMQNELIAAAVRSTAIPTVFPLHALANGDITVPPSGNVDVGMGMYPSSMCGSGTFDDPLQLLGENPDTFMSTPTVEQLVATINTLTESPQSQENVSSDSESIDPTQAFNLDDFVKDFGIPASHECESFDPVEERAGEQNITTTLSVVSRSSPATSSSHSESVGSPMPSFYATPAPTPPLAPRGAANAGPRRVGGTWKVPMGISRIASPIPSCAASPNQVVA